MPQSDVGIDPVMKCVCSGQWNAMLLAKWFGSPIRSSGPSHIQLLRLKTPPIHMAGELPDHRLWDKAKVIRTLAGSRRFGRWRKANASLIRGAPNGCVVIYDGVNS
jgi:hypothetical protein